MARFTHPFRPSAPPSIAALDALLLPVRGVAKPVHGQLYRDSSDDPEAVPSVIRYLGWVSSDGRPGEAWEPVTVDPMPRGQSSREGLSL